jgi:hypothetical protein
MLFSPVQHPRGSARHHGQAFGMESHQPWDIVYRLAAKQFLTVILPLPHAAADEEYFSLEVPRYRFICYNMIIVSNLNTVFERRFWLGSPRNVRAEAPSWLGKVVLFWLPTSRSVSASISYGTSDATIQLVDRKVKWRSPHTWTARFDMRYCFFPWFLHVWSGLMIRSLFKFVDGVRLLCISQFR